MKRKRGRPAINPEDRRTIIFQFGTTEERLTTKEIRRRFETFLAESTPPEHLKGEGVGIHPVQQNVRGKDWGMDAIKYQIRLTQKERQILKDYARSGSVTSGAVMRRAMAEKPITELDGDGGGFVRMTFGTSMNAQEPDTQNPTSEKSTVKKFKIVQQEIFPFEHGK